MKQGDDKRADLQSLRDLAPTVSTDADRVRTAADPVFMRILNDIVQNADSRPWREVMDGVKIRPLWDDRTYLLRCAAGKHVPCHVHDREEFLVVLDGQMRIGEALLFTGDIEISRAGSEHPTAEAIEDCLVLVQNTG